MGIYLNSTKETIVKALSSEADTHNYISYELIEAYTWLEKQETRGTILFSKHYENVSKRWFPKDSFIRSALSGKQYYSEHVKYKGVIMEPDYIERYAKNIFFYSSFVNSSPSSKHELKKFKVTPVKSEKSAKPYHSNYSLGKKWYFNNKFNKLRLDVPVLLTKQSKNKTWLITFLKEYDIHYIILEWGDKPGVLLSKLTHPIYKSNSIIILKVKKT